MVAPFIFIDELIYSELAKSLADGGGYAIRGVSTSGYSLLYPALVAPAWGLFDDGVTAYNAAKSINAVAMSLAAIPTYFLAIRVARPPLALLAAADRGRRALHGLHGDDHHREPLLPRCALLALALVRYLERASWRRLGRPARCARGRLRDALAGARLRTRRADRSARARADPRGRRRAARFVPLYGVVLGAGAACRVVQAVRGNGPFDLLGAYSTVGESHYDVGQVLRFWLWHVEEFVLYVAVVPVVALVVLLARVRSLPPRLQEHVAAATTFFVWSTLAVGMFASRFAPDRVQDRYLFFLTPLLVVALIAWVELGAPRPRITAACGRRGRAAARARVPLRPLHRRAGEVRHARAHPALGLPGAPASRTRTGAPSPSSEGRSSRCFLLVPARWALAVPIAVLVVFALLSRPVWTSDKGFIVAGQGRAPAGHRRHAAHVDRRRRGWARRGRGAVDAATPTGSRST